MTDNADELNESSRINNGTTRKVLHVNESQILRSQFQPNILHNQSSFLIPQFLSDDLLKLADTIPDMMIRSDLNQIMEY